MRAPRSAPQAASTVLPVLGVALSGLVAIFAAAWMTVLPSIGLLYLTGCMR